MMEGQRKNSLIKFAITGVGATLIHVCVASYLITQHAAMPGVANGCAFVVANAFSYVVNTYWSFSSRSSLANATRFWFTSVLGFAVSVTLSTLADYLGFHYLIGIAMIVIVVPIMTFTIHSLWTFKK